MANSVARAGKFLPVIDEVYRAESVTEGLDASTQADFTNANEIKVLKVATTGLGAYSRTGGYPKGDITVTWETMKLTQERGKEISIDRMDDEEMLGVVFGTVTGSFLREWVIPELDAYRFSKYASTAGITTATAADLTKDTILGAIDEAAAVMDENEVPQEGRVLFVNSGLKPALSQAFERQWGSEDEVSDVIRGYNNMKVVYVPKNRFYTKIDIQDGSSSWGYSKNAQGKGINFMMVYPPALVQAKKFMLPKVFRPEENQKMDAWLFQFRLYHDAFVYENKAKGVYVHPMTE